MSSSTLIAFVAISLDGFLAGTNDSLAFLPHPEDTDFGSEAFFQTIDAMVMGRRTYEITRHLEGNGFDKVPTYIVSHHRYPSDAHPVIDLKTLKETIHGRIFVVGGGNLIQSLMEADMLDELRLFLVPKTLGQGIPLWGNIVSAWELASVQKHPYGLAELVYHKPRK
ncbi:MAG: dihydrofolate reductase family protein [Bacillus subtilis]|nr:dihydrofolate reductase family protein [Bacillus subtilis]